MDDLLYRFNPWWERTYQTGARPRPRYLGPLRRELGTPDVLLLTGLRRVGKTTLMHQLVEELLQATPPQQILYASMDHPAFQGISILDVLETYRTVHRIPREEKVYLFLDEVHHVPNFDRDLKIIHDMEKAKVVASGSSSMVLRHESAALTGRHKTLTVRPLDFAEFLAFRDVHVEPSEGYLLEGHLRDHLRLGGIPEHVLRDDVEYLTSLVDSIIYKDIVARHAVRHPDLLRQLFLLLAERAGKTLTFRKLAAILGVRPDTIKQYITYFEETFLVHLVQRHARSLNARTVAPKKLYLADVGIRNAYTGMRDLGAVAENAVFLRLLDNGEVRYHRDGGKEVDFVQNGTAYEVKYRRDVTRKEVDPLIQSHFKHKVLLSLGGPAIDGVESIPLGEFLRTGPITP